MHAPVRLSFVLALSLLRSVAAYAAEGEEETFARRGFYLGGGGLLAFENFDSEVSGTVGGDIAIEADNSWGLEGRAGYRFHEHAAGEVQIQYFDQFDASARRPGIVGKQDFSLDGTAFTGNVKFFPWTGRFQPYLLGGIGFEHLKSEDLDDSDTTFAGRAGGGVDVYLNTNIAFFIEMTYLLPTGDLGGFRLIPLTVGAQYHF